MSDFHAIRFALAGNGAVTFCLSLGTHALVTHESGNLVSCEYAGGEALYWGSDWNIGVTRWEWIVLSRSVGLYVAPLFAPYFY